MKDLVIIGGGPAGMSAAIAAKENGVKNASFICGKVEDFIDTFADIDAIIDNDIIVEVSHNCCKSNKKYWRLYCCVSFYVIWAG